MASHCPVCDSTNIERRVGPPPKSVVYYHCNDCGSNFGTPVVDPQVSPAPAEEVADNAKE